MDFKGADSKTYRQIRGISDTIKHGKCISIDPASKCMGYAIIEQGVITETGVVVAPPYNNIGGRLEYMYNAIKEKGPYDAAFIEKVRSSQGHIYLVWSAGTAIAASGAPTVIEVSTSMWKKLAREDTTYSKSDEADAIKIAEVVLECIKDNYATQAQKDPRT
jgi:Holliday junction resolvasome RuvABC endonuclease subunit